MLTCSSLLAFVSFGFQGAIALKAPDRGNTKHHSLVVGSSGLEPPTSRLSGARSNRLSYEPITTEMRAFRIEQRMRRGLCSDQSIGDADRSASRFSLERR